MPLTELTCKNAKPADKAHRMSDTEGLYLEVMPNGSKYWRLKYRLHGKESRYAIGVYPKVKLSDARQERDAAKKLISQGIHPSHQKQAVKEAARQNAENTFQAVAEEWFAIKSHDWSDKYAKKVRQGLEKNIYSYLGKRPIADIKPPELLAILRQIESRGALDITQRTNQICSQIFKYGIQTGRCEWNAAQNLSGATRRHKKEHFRTLDQDQLPTFIKALECNEPRLYSFTRRALWLCLFTFVRPGELRQMRWEDLDLKMGLWTIPAFMMKKRQEHIVPLSKQTVALIEEQREEFKMFNTPWVFPSQRGPAKPMSDGTLNKAIRRLGFGDELVAHGFRALARTAIREKLGYDSEIIEKQLAHKSPGPLGEAYDRTKFLDDRKKMMQDWADFVDALTNDGDIIRGKFKRKA